MKDWEYANLVKEASLHGGVDAYCNDLREEGYINGQEHGILQGMGIAAIIAGLCKVGQKIYLSYKEKKAIAREQAAAAEEALKNYLASSEDNEIHGTEIEEDGNNETD